MPISYQYWSYPLHNTETRRAAGKVSTDTGWPVGTLRWVWVEVWRCSTWSGDTVSSMPHISFAYVTIWFCITWIFRILLYTRAIEPAFAERTIAIGGGNNAIREFNGFEAQENGLKDRSTTTRDKNLIRVTNCLFTKRAIDYRRSNFWDKLWRAEDNTISGKGWLCVRPMMG